MLLQICCAASQKRSDVIVLSVQLCLGYVKSVHRPENEVVVLHVLEIDVGKISKQIKAMWKSCSSVRTTPF